MNVKKSMKEMIGRTPLLEASRFAEEKGITAKLWLKAEFLNPTGSVKDRAALGMIEDAEARGILKPGMTIVEPTSGNTGIGLAAIGTVSGYKVLIVLPETMSVERRNLMKAYGAELILTDGKAGMKGAIDKADELVAEHDDYILAGQFINPANPQKHYGTTGPEIWEDTDGTVDVLVSGVGTGGTVTGTGRYLKEKNPSVHVVAVEPASSPVLSGGAPGAHAIQGIGAGFVPEVLNTEVYDEVVQISNDDAVTYAKALGRTEGILVGISGGAALAAATEIAKREEFAGKRIVVILPDSADRYYSTALFQEV